MWFKLAGATFTNNLGTMDSISKSYMMDYSGLTGLQASPGSVSYATDSTPDATITFTVKSGYVFKSGSTVTASGGATGTYTASADIAAGSTFTMTLTAIASKVTFSGAAELVSGGSTGGDVTPTTYTFTINPTPSTATVTLTASGYTQSGNSITVPSGTSVSWSVSADGYTTQSGTQSVTSTSSKSVSLVAEESDTATLTVNASPSGASVTLYAKGYTQSGQSITVANDGTVSPTYQVTYDEYLSQGGTVSKITTNQTIDVSLQPITEGTVTTVDLDTEGTLYNTYFMTTAGKNNGPYTTWYYYIVPVTAGQLYRVRSTSGQNAQPWMLFSELPDGTTGTVKPVRNANNTGMTKSIIAEFTPVEGETYVVLNGRKNSSDTPITLEKVDI